MVNKTTNTPEEEQSSTADAGPTDSLYNANKAAERLENANKELAKLLALQEQMQVKKTIDGHADTGVKQESAEDKEIAEAKQFLAGTGMEDYCFPPEKK
jgi:hypothetical protein